MHASGKSVRTVSTSTWDTSAIGDPAGWPAPLRLAADLMFNTPLPMLLEWRSPALLLCNDAYGALAGPTFSQVPGGALPALLPPPFAAAGAAMAQAWSGAPAQVTGAQVNFGTPNLARYDLHLTPLPDSAGVGGVLCAVAPARLDDAANAAPDAPDTLDILVVEDNLDSQYLVCEMLRAFGHQAEGVAHPDEALSQLAAHPYQLLFTDVSLPGMSGVDLARTALQRQPQLKVIFASGYGDTLLRHLDFPYQSLQKPYELEQLQAALGKVARQLTMGS